MVGNVYGMRGNELARNDRMMRYRWSCLKKVNVDDIADAGLRC